MAINIISIVYVLFIMISFTSPVWGIPQSPCQTLVDGFKCPQKYLIPNPDYNHNNNQISINDTLTIVSPSDGLCEEICSPSNCGGFAGTPCPATNENGQELACYYPVGYSGGFCLTDDEMIQEMQELLDSSHHGDTKMDISIRRIQGSSDRGNVKRSECGGCAAVMPMCTQPCRKCEITPDSCYKCSYATCIDTGANDTISTTTTTISGVAKSRQSAETWHGDDTNNIKVDQPHWSAFFLDGIFYAYAIPIFILIIFMIACCMKYRVWTLKKFKGTSKVEDGTSQSLTSSKERITSPNATTRGQEYV